MYKRRTLIGIGISLLSGLAALYLEMFFEMCDNYNYGYSNGILYENITKNVCLRFVILLFCFYAALIVLYLYREKMTHFVFEYRYIIALAVILVCIFFKLSGSSISEWKIWIGGDESLTRTFWGVPRMCRGDEFAVFTPYAFSQEFNHSGSYLYYSNTIRGMKTDVSVVYGQPSYNIITLFRPFLLGFLFLGSERGLSFFWITRVVALFMITFEFARTFTKDNRWLSFFCAVAVTFGPAMQWWFAINGLVEMLVFGQAAIMCFDRYLRTNDYKKRIVYSGILTYCGLGYIFTIYPAWQVSFGYIFLALAIIVIVNHRKNFNLQWKKDGVFLLSAIFIIGGVLLYFWGKSGDTILSYIQTEYPGKRVSQGGGALGRLFQEGTTLFLPLDYNNLYPLDYQNEMSLFFSFFPLGIILTLIVFLCDKKKDPTLIGLGLVQVCLIAYCCISLPENVSKITLLSFCTPLRVTVAVGYINVLQLVRSIAVLNKTVQRKYRILFSTIFASFIVMINHYLSGQYMRTVFDVILWLVLFCGCSLVLMNRSELGKKGFVVFASFIVLLSGITVNPIQKGCRVIFDNPLIQEIRKISDGDDGLWLVEGKYPLTEVPIFVGAPTINSTNMYPAFERWKLIDKDNKYREIYNRYAHIDIELTKDYTEFVMGNAADAFTIRLNDDDLDTLNVKYILSLKDHTLDQFNDKLTKISQIGAFHIYQVNE